MKNSLIFSALMLCCGLIGCSRNDNNLTAPGDDFPNSRHAIAQAITGGFSYFSRAAEFTDFADSIPDLSIAESLLVKPLAQSSAPAIQHNALGRVTESRADSTFLDYADTAAGLLRRFTYTNALLVITSQAETILYNDAARDTVDSNDIVLSIQGRSRFLLSNALLDYAFADRDSNGFIDSGTVTETVPELVTTTVTSVTGAFPNTSVSTSITVGSLSQTIIRSPLGDTLSTFSLIDADADGNLYDPIAEANHVIYTQRQRNTDFANYPGVVSHTVAAYLVLIPADSSLQIRNLAMTSLLNSGGREQFHLYGFRPDSSFFGGDSAIMRFRADHQYSQGFDTVDVRFVLQLDSDIFAIERHAISRISLRATTLLDPIEVIELDYRPSVPLMAGSTQFDGAFEAFFTFLDGHHATMTGSLRDEVFSGVYRHERGTVDTLTWDSKGVILDAQ